MKKCYSLVFAVMVAALFSACGSKNRNIVILIDISNSINVDVEEWYLQSIEKDVCSSLSQFDKIKILPVDGASVTASQPLLELDFYEYRKEWDKMGLNANETDKLKTEAFQKFIHNKMIELKANIESAKKYRSGFGNQTDILGALQNVTNSYDSKRNNYLIVLSDMEQYADKLKMSETGHATEWIIQTKGIRLDDIKKFSVIILTGEQLSQSKTYYNEIKSYWYTYLKQQGVKDSEIKYDSAELDNLHNSLLVQK